MKNRKNGLRRVIALAVVGYGLLLCLLVAAERTHEGALIDTLPKALWYSLVTLTTVGYGELYPVTLPGKLIGGAFLLMSTGLLALLVGLIYAAVAGRLFPRLKLWRHRRATWYVFSSDSGAALALASQLTDGLVVFCHSAGRTAGDALSTDLSPQALFGLRCAGAGPRRLFAMDDDAASNERLAAELKDYPIDIYCRCDIPDEDLPDNVTAFDDAACTARLYWQSQPWRPAGERAALIGRGRFAQALLEQGLLTAPPGCEIELFGDWSAWRAVHRALDEAPDLQIRLHFHSEDWRACADALAGADRLILCEDAPEANREALGLLRRFYVIPGAVHARCGDGLRNAVCFGDAGSVFTPELVMKQALNARARQLHELYRASVDYPVPAWEALPEFAKRSNLAAADHLLTKLRLLLPEEDVRAITPEVCRRAAQRYGSADPGFKEDCRRVEHSRWCLFHALYNWRCAPVRDNAARLHPLMVSYEQLDEAERRKDDNAWLLLSQLAETDSLQSRAR